MVALHVDNITCIRGARELFRGLSFSLTEGQILCLCGPNGSGKTSLLRCLAGLLPLSGGTVTIENNETQEERTAGLIHWCGVNPAIREMITVRQNLEFWAGLYHAPHSNTDIDKTLTYWDLDTCATLPARYLSTGQKQSLSLARLQLQPRPLWLLDEPAAGLDEANLARLQNLASAHLGNNGLAVIATHNPDRWHGVCSSPPETLSLGSPTPANTAGLEGA